MEKAKYQGVGRIWSAASDDMKAASANLKSNFINLSRVSYLIADKIRINRMLLVRALRNFSASDVREADDIKPALAMIYERPPDIVLLGVAMGQTEKVEFLKGIRDAAKSLSVNIPCVAISDAVCSEDGACTICLGADSHISIPFSIATLEAHLIKVLKDRQPRARALLS
ncbi:MAG: response regulator [Rhizomicrobium sp.]